MKIVNENPPNWDYIKNIFDCEGKDVVFTWGDVIYNPSGKEIPDYLIAHEEVHRRQQGKDPAAWWQVYVADPSFRVSQEVEAYAVEYLYIKERTNTKTADRFLDDIAMALGSEVYGNVISPAVARIKILREARKQKTLA